MKTAATPDDHQATTLNRTLALALSYRDMNTHLHSDRVGKLALAMGRHCRLSSHELEPLGIGAALHDIGKIGIPDAILNHPGKLDDEQRRYMHEHSAIGERILASTGSDEARAAATLVRHHHEHFDGGGYPDGLSGEDIPVGARIIGIVDAYDAMMERRAYHAAGSQQEVLAVLHGESGSKFDPHLLHIFCTLIEQGDLAG